MRILKISKAIQNDLVLKPFQKMRFLQIKNSCVPSGNPNSNYNIIYVVQLH